MKSLIAQQLTMGDEGHNRNRAGSALMARVLAPALAETGLDRTDLGRGPRYFPLAPARGRAGSTLVTAMARNGTDFGIRVSGLGNRLFVAPAEIPVGLFSPGFSQEDANPDI